MAESKSGNKKKIVLWVSIIAAFFLVLILITMLVIGSGPKSLVKKFGNTLEKANSEKMCDLLNEELSQDYHLENRAWDNCDNVFDGEKYKDFVIGNSKKVVGTELEEIANDLEYSDVIDVDKDLKKVIRYKVTFKFKNKYSDYYKEKIQYYVWVGKIKSDWSIIGITEKKEYDDDFEIFWLD